jgi:hypothetical protein
MFWVADELYTSVDGAERETIALADLALHFIDGTTANAFDALVAILCTGIVATPAVKRVLLCIDALSVTQDLPAWALAMALAALRTGWTGFVTAAAMLAVGAEVDAQRGAVNDTNRIRVVGALTAALVADLADSTGALTAPTMASILFEINANVIAKGLIGVGTSAISALTGAIGGAGISATPTMRRRSEDINTASDGFVIGGVCDTKALCGVLTLALASAASLTETTGLSTAAAMLGVGLCIDALAVASVLARGAVLTCRRVCTDTV